MKKLAIITSHPIQYNAPLYQLLAARNRVVVKVFYTWGQAANNVVYDPEFKKAFKWDIPLLSGYDYELVENISPKPGSHNFKGIINKDLIQHIDAWQPDALLVYGWSFHSHLKVMRHYKKRIPVLFRGDSTLLMEKKGFSIKKIMRRLFLSWVYRYIDTALYVGDANKDYYLSHGVKEKQLVFAPHAVDNARFEDPDGTAEAKAALWRRELGIPEQDFVFLFAGKLEYQKNPFLLLEAFEKAALENAWLVIVGNGVYEEEMKAKAAGNKRIIFIGFQNQQAMPVVYRLGNVFVLPSVSETWGLGINEAMACGRAVLVSDICGGARNLVEQGKNGYIFRSGDLKDFVSAMTALYHNNGSVSGMGQYSREKIREFSMERIAITIEQVI